MSSRPDTVAGLVRAVDADGVDSVWVTVDTATHSQDAGFAQSFSARYQFVIPAGQPVGTHIPMMFRARDVAAFETQKDTYVVVVP